MCEEKTSTIPSRCKPADAVALGVCGGIAHHYKRDPTLIRIAFIVFFVINIGAALLVYLFIGLIMKMPPKEEKVEESPEEEKVCRCKKDKK